MHAGHNAQLQFCIQNIAYIFFFQRETIASILKSELKLSRRDASTRRLTLSDAFCVDRKSYRCFTSRRSPALCFTFFTLSQHMPANCGTTYQSVVKGRVANAQIARMKMPRVFSREKRGSLEPRYSSCQPSRGRPLYKGLVIIEAVPPSVRGRLWIVT